MKKTPKFFCEHCGAEVRQHAKFCKKCGRFFSSVRCPMCGKSGEAPLFSNGCPFCGYAIGKEQRTPPVNQKSAKRHDPLPAWLYVVSAGALIGLLCAIFFRAG
jgi:uncharacterized membrane protein YvbJ